MVHYASTLMRQAEGAHSSGSTVHSSIPRPSNSIAGRSWEASRRYVQKSGPFLFRCLQASTPRCRLQPDQNRTVWLCFVQHYATANGDGPATKGDWRALAIGGSAGPSRSHRGAAIFVYVLAAVSRGGVGVRQKKIRPVKFGNGSHP